MSDIYDYLMDGQKPIIIYGMGNGAEKVMDELERRKLRVSAVAASEGFVRGQSFRGFEVQGISSVCERYPGAVVLIAFGTQLPDVIEKIGVLEKKYDVRVADVPVYGDNFWCREFYEENSEQINRAYELLADGQSQKTFEDIISFRQTGRLEFLKNAWIGKEEAFSEILCLRGDESYLDLGAYRGDTIDEFLSYSGGSYQYITALEPDRKTFAKLKAHTKGMENVRLFRMGIWSEDADLPFESSKGRGSGLREGGQENLAVTSIDTLYRIRKLTYCKMDVEGSEYQALIGAERTLRRDRPKLNIAAYHRTEDFFTLPLLIHSIVPEYRIYLRQHPYIPDWDLNIYCCPI